MPARVKTLIGWSITPLLSIALSAAPPEPRLADAVKRQDRQAIHTLLEQRVDVNARQPDGATALHWAMHWNDLETAERLIQAGAQLNATNDYGVTPLSLACTNASRAAVTLLLEAGANPNLPLPTGETPLMTASRTGNLEVVHALLARGADANARELAQKQTALMWAVAEKHAEVARALIARGADARARSDRGVTPLLFAARQGDIASARLLLENGADVNEAAADRLSPLIVSTVRGHVPLAIFLLDRGADPNAAASGFTALHWAAGIWETELTGPRGIATTRDEEWRALRGVQSGKPELVKALLAHGADPNARVTRAPQRVGFTRGGLNLVGASAFLIAAAAGDAELMRMLAASGADPTLTTSENTTALMAAAGVGRVTVESSVSDVAALEAVKVALSFGADVNAANANGDTALHGAATIRSEPLVRFLIDRGARIDVKNKRGQTPLANARGSAAADLLQKLSPAPAPDTPNQK
jgi:ankyrin repeat protein